MYSPGFSGSLAYNPIGKVNGDLRQEKEHLSRFDSNRNMASC